MGFLELLTGGKGEPERMPVNPKDIAQRVDAYETRKSRLKMEWKEMLAMHAGQQWIQADTAFRNYVELRSAYRQTQAVENLIQSYAGTAVSMLTRNQPIPKCVPIGNNPTDEERAKIGTALLEHIWQCANVSELDEVGTLWAILTGNAGYKVYWDHELGDSYHVETELDEETGEPVEHQVKDGLPVVEILAPFSFGWNDATTLEKSPWYYHRAIFTVEDVEDRYGVKVKADSDPEDIQAGGVIRFDTTVKANARPLGVAVTEWWQRPCAKYPQGLHCVVTKDRVLLDEDWEETYLCPIYHLGLEPTPGSPWFRTPFRDGIPIQKEINRITSDAMDHTTNAAYPATVAPVGSRQGQWSRTPGAKLEYDPSKGPAPQPMVLDKMEPWVLQFLNDLHSRFEYVVGISGVMLGHAAFSRMSGRISGQFIEQTTNRWANVAARKGRLLSKVGIALLELWRRYGPETVTVRVVGNDGIESYQDVARDGFSYKTLHIEVDEVLATSRQAKLETYERWLQYGAIDGANFLRLVAKIDSEIGDLEGSGPDRAMAQRHIAQMRLGQFPTLKPPANWKVLFESVSAYMKTAEYQDLIERVPEAEQMFDQYLAEVDAILNPPMAPGVAGPSGPMTPNAPPADGISGPVSSPPGAQNVPPEANGSMGSPGVDAAEESAIRGAG